jgi:hypothetical protein
MSGIYRYPDGRIRVYTTLGANGWKPHERQSIAFPCYTRGGEVIELDPDNVAFYSVGDRRITNGTWEQIVERFAVDLNTVATLSKAQLGVVIDDLGEIDETLVTPTQAAAINNAIVTLKQYRETLEV